MRTYPERLFQFLPLFLLGLALVLSGCDSSGSNDDGDPPPSDDVVVTIDSLVSESDNFTTLNQALVAANVTALDDENTNYTVFAPTDDAFNALNVDALLGSDALGSVLQYHVIEGDSLRSGDLSDGQTLTTLAGQDLTVEVDESGNVSVEGSPVTDADITADNGVIHGIGDKPLLGNQELTNVLQFVSETQELVSVIVARGLADGIGGSDVGTVFAPNNSAVSGNGETIDNLSDDEVQSVLEYHTLADETDSGALLSLLSDNDGQVTVQTRQGEDLVIAQDGDGNVLFNPTDQGAQATLDTDNVDFEGTNNITHVIDGLLIPPSFAQPSITQARSQARQAISGGDDASATVTVQGTVTRAFGAFARFQDDSGPTGASGLVIRQTSDDTDGDLDDQFRQDIADGNIGPGTVIRVTGAISQFSGLLQFNGDGLQGYEIVEQGNPPQAQTVSVTDLASPDGEDYESELLRVEDLSFPQASGSFESGTTYTVEDADGNTFAFRVQGDDETNVIGESIPSGTFAFEGVLSQFNVFSGVDTDEGYQLVPVQPSDIQ